MKEALESTAYLAFVHNEKDCELLRKTYSDSAYVRLPLRKAKKLIPYLPSQARTWIDAEIDGLQRLPDRASQYRSYIEGFKHYRSIMDVQFQAKPESKIVREFVNSVLDGCRALKPSLISVPQLPIIAGNERNKINRELAKAAAAWAGSYGFSGALILPVIFTHPNQLLKKTARNPKVALARQCVEAAGAHRIWIVDSSLMDQEGAKSLENRFRAIVDLHEEIANAMPAISVVGGPYWGLNIVLWSKGLIKHPAITLGNRYRYYLSGGMAQLPNTRIAFGCLKRWVVVKPELRDWLSKALKDVPPSDPAYLEFAELHKKFTSLIHGDNREQICQMYRNWLDSLSSIPPPGRGLTLYQQLSSAYVLGKGLAEFPEQGLARRPERVAQQLMLFCL